MCCRIADHHPQTSAVEQASTEPADAECQAPGTRDRWGMYRDRAFLRRAEPTVAQPLVVSRDPACVDELVRLCAAAAVDADVVREPARIGGRWTRASCVLVGEDCAGDMATLRVRRRDDVVLVGRQPPADTLWRSAVQIGAADVVVLPDDAGRVADRLAEASTPGHLRAHVVGVVGVGGGAGASTVAAGLADAYARRRRRSLLIDADALGGGIELLVGCEDVPGLRWPDIDLDEGRVAPNSLMAALPSANGVSVLSSSAGASVEPDPAALRTMIGAGRRGCGLVVLDLPRRFDAQAVGVATAELDTLLVVATTEIRSVAAGRQVVGAAVGLCSDIRAVVRTTPRRRLEPDAVADALGIALVGAIPSRRAVSRAAEDGVGVVRGWRASRSHDQLLSGLLRADGPG
jgi:secretion/DNA translocation related CpaE-like protein